MTTIYAHQMGPAIRASLSIHHFGIPAEKLEKAYGDQAIQAAHSKEFRGFGIKDVLLQTIKASGRTYSGSLNTDEFIRAAFEASRTIRASGTSSMSLDAIFEDVMGKALLDAFMVAHTHWRAFTAITSANDFKPVKRYRLTNGGGFQEVGDDGQLKHAGLSETKRTIEIDTKGVILTLTRKMILSDDLSSLRDITRRIGQMASSRLEEDAFKLLLSLVGTFFSAGNKNYIEGADTALGPDSLATARQMFRDQVDANAKPIMTSPAQLLVGTTLESMAKSLFHDEFFEVGTSTQRAERIRNEHFQQFPPIVSPYLNNTAIRDVRGKAIANQSDVHWLLLADPDTAPVLEAAFLNGQETPTVETSEMSFEKLGMQMRAFMDFGFAEAETVGGVYSKGAA